MAEIVADAGVEIDSDLTKFARDLARKIKPIVDAVKAEIAVGADTSKVEKSVAAAKKDIETGKAADVKVDGDTHPLDLSVLLAKRKIEASPAAKVKVEAEVNVDKDRRNIFNTFTQLGSSAGKLFTEGITKGLTNIGETFSDVGRDIVGGIVRAGAILLVTLPAAAGAVVALSQATLILLPLLGAVPGVIAAAGAVAGVAALAFHGMADALAGDKDAINKLSPAAAELVRTLRSFIPALSEVQKSVQQKIFQNLSGPIRELIDAVFPAFRDSVVRIAELINLQLVGALSVLNSEVGRQRINQIFSGVAEIIRGISLSVPSLVDAFLALAAAGTRIFSKVAPKISETIIDVANRIAKFADSGGLEKAFDKAVTFAKDLFNISKQIFEIIKEIGTAVAAGFTSFLGGGEGDKVNNLIGLLQKLREALQNPIIQEALKGIGQALFILLAAVVGATLVIGLLVAIIVRIGEALVATIQAINAFQVSIQNLINTVGAAIAGFLITIVQNIVAMVQGILDSLSRLGQGIQGALLPIPAFFSTIFSAAFAIAQSIVSTGAAFIFGMMAALPGQISGAIASIPGLLSSLFNTAMGAARNAVSAGIQQVQSLMASIPGRIRSAIGDLSGLLTGAGRSIVQGLIDGIQSKIGSLKSAASNLASAVKNYLPNSPAKAGPFRGRGAPEKSGAHIASAVAQGLRDGQGALGVAAAQTAQIVASSFDQLIKDAVSGRSGGSFRPGASIPGFADGGLVTKPTLAMVGERGPELIVPFKAPNAAGGSSQVTKNYSPTINVQSSAADPEIVANRLLRHLVGAY